MDCSIRVKSLVSQLSLLTSNCRLWVMIFTKLLSGYICCVSTHYSFKFCHLLIPDILFQCFVYKSTRSSTLFYKPQPPPPPLVTAIFSGIDVTNDGGDSADEASDLEDIAVVDDTTQRFAAAQSLDLPPAKVKQADSQATDSISESSKQLPALHAISPQAALVMETKDIARLKQTIADLERKLKSR